MNDGGCLKLASGFAFDYANLWGEDKVTDRDLAALGDRLASAQAAIERLRATGEVRGHLAKDGTPEPVLFTQLPYIADGRLNSPASLQRLREFGQSLRYKTDCVVSFGIGGSYLGNKVLFDVHGGEFWNHRPPAERAGYPKLFFSGNNIDPHRTAQLVDCLLTEARTKALDGRNGVYRVRLIVISKSGSTIDTISNFLVVYDQLRRHSPPLEVGVTVVTGPAAGNRTPLLRKLAAQEGWETFLVPDGVGGRFSVLTAASIGFDLDAFLAGARSMDQACQTGDIRQNPALLNAALKYLAAERYGRDIEVFMPYGDCLKSLAEWYIQLLAESLGKRTDRAGREVFYGRTPVAAVGTTDMHAQTQQHQDGKHNKVVQFVRVLDWETTMVIPAPFPDVTALSALAGIGLDQALEAARAANAAALTADGRFNATFTLPRLDAFSLGELMFMLMLSVAYEGELADVDAFDQPGVEAYKRQLGPRLKKLVKQL